MGKFTYDGFTGTFDASDYAFTERYEAEANAMQEKASQLVMDGSPSKYIADYCEIVFAFFRALFGEETDKEMFGETRSIRECDKALAAMADAYKADLLSLAKESEEMRARISGNRAQRRRKQ